MDAYEQLKRQAAEKRDTVILRARKEYRHKLRRIDELRHTLGGDAPAGKQSRSRPITELIADLMPRDKPFTFADIHRILSAAEPNRTFNQLTLRTTLRELAKQGVVERVSKNQSGRVMWAAAGSAVTVSQFGAMALTDVAEKLLRERGPMTPIELVVAIQEAGYRADADPRRMVAALKNAARRYPGRFKAAESGRWGA